MAGMKSIKKQATALAKSQFVPKTRSRGIRSNLSYAESLTRIGKWCHNTYGIERIDKISIDMIIGYFEERRQVVGNSTLTQERQALRLLTEREKSKLYLIDIPFFKSELKQILKSRRYSKWQIDKIKEKQSTKNRIATEVAAVAGLRAHELLTLRRIEERKPSARNWNPNMYIGKSEWKRYTVVGKGGLIREIRLPNNIVKMLESRRLTHPITVNDRGIYYNSYYDIGGGKNWTSSVSKTSKKSLGWSNGAHGFRHTYVQDRVYEIQRLGFSEKEAKAIVSQEIGHHRPDIINAYLR